MRTILVLALVSSMKTSFLASSLAWSAFQYCRASATSARQGGVTPALACSFILKLILWRVKNHRIDTSVVFTPSP